MQTCLSSDILINKGLDRLYSLHSVINSMTGCRLYNLSKPLLMRMSELKQVCIKEQVPSHEVKVTQKMNEHVPGVICHSVSPGRGSQLQAFPSVCCRSDNVLHMRPTYSAQFLGQESATIAASS